ncbi:MAG: hypothetical protein K2J20_06000, partial [Bacilli bacterium]|nr:hypothetical protein [Bacilli bacterium]
IESILVKIFKKYRFTEEERIRFLNIVFPILSHEEFKKRTDSTLYPHHDTTSLGEHILSDAAVAFKLAEKKEHADQYLAVVIAMFHDLYEIPWQNSGIIKNDFFNKHGFVHPLEAAINAATWYSEYFTEPKKAEIIIDGIVHHMFPFPVRALNGDNIELNNESKFGDLPINIRNMIISSSLRNKIGKISLVPSKFIEGRIVDQADKRVSFSKDFTLTGAIACVTGVNKNLEQDLEQKRYRH